MTSKTNERIIRYAPYAAAGDVLTEPTMISHLSHRSNTVRTINGKAQDTSRTGDGGEKRVRTKTGDNCGIDFSDAMRGVSVNTGVTLVPATVLASYSLLEHAMGAAVNTPTAAAAMTYVAAGGGTPASGTFAVDDATKTAPGNAFAYTTAAGEFIIRETVSESSLVLTMDRNATAPADAAECQQLLTFALDPDGDMPFIMFDVEDGAGDYRSKIEGAQCLTLTFDFPADGEVTYSMSFEGNHFERASAASPSYVAPGMGSGIRVVDSPLYLGNTEYCFRGGQLVVTIQGVVLPCTNGPNGRMGMAINGRDATFSGSFYLGDGSNPKEVPHTGAGVSVEQMNEEGSYDLALQLGTGVTKCMYVRMPNADFLAAEGEADGVDIVNFGAMATKSDNHSNVPGGLRIHVG